jgi:hypothetical protein
MIVPGVRRPPWSGSPSSAPAGQPGRTSETGRHPRPGASRLTRRAVPTGPFDTNHLAPLGNAGAGTKTYKVVKEYTPGAGWFYNTYIDTSKQSTQTASVLETCWNGVDAVEIANEVYNPNSQSGGSVSNPQTYSAVYWYDGSTWQAVVGSQGGNCDTIQLSTMRCMWQQFDPSKWDSWDTRWP